MLENLDLTEMVNFCELAFAKFEVAKVLVANGVGLDTVYKVL